MISVALQVITIVAAVIVLSCSIGVLNKMSPRSDHIMRVSYILISSGCFGEIIAVFGGHAPGIAETLFVVGLGILSISERRAVKCPFDNKELRPGA